MHALSVRFGKALRSGGHGTSLNFNSIIRACVSSKGKEKANRNETTP